MVTSAALAPSGATSSDHTPPPADRALSVSVLPPAVTAVRAACVTIRDASGGAGSGVVIEPGIVATCAHVVEGSPLVEVRDADGFIYPGRVVRTDGHGYADTAIIVCADLKTAPATIQAAPPQADEPVYAIGTPAGIQELAGAVKAGLVHSVSGDGVFWLDIQVIPGNSGGPLVNAAGAVVGLVAATITGAYGIAVPISVALRLLAEYRAGLAPVSAGPGTSTRRAEWLRAQNITQPAPVAGGASHMDQTTQAAGQAAPRPVALGPEDEAKIEGIFRKVLAEMMAAPEAEPEMSEQAPPPSAPQAFPTSAEDAGDALQAAGATPELAALLAPVLVAKMPTDKPAGFKALAEGARKVMEAVKASTAAPAPAKPEPVKESAKPEPQKVAALTAPAKLESGKKAPSNVRAQVFTGNGK